MYCHPCTGEVDGEVGQWLVVSFGVVDMAQWIVNEQLPCGCGGGGDGCKTRG